MIPVIAIFDVGRTNKKRLLFDTHYSVVDEQSESFSEITDEDGEPCEDVFRLRDWLRASLEEVLGNPAYDVRAVHVSGYGASMVHLDEAGGPVTPLYSYLKPFPERLHEQFYGTYGGEAALSRQTASPVLGSLNSGLQLYRIKYEQPERYAQIRYTLHLPQYLSYVLTGRPCTDLTSVGCHTLLWDFDRQRYHDWVSREGLDEKFPPLFPGDAVMSISVSTGRTLPMGVGLHDSSSALIPYLASVQEPFVLLSTGTWCVSMNPFNATPLTDEELQYDCLCYLTYRGKPVKSSRLFAGHEHEMQLKRLAHHYGVAPDSYKSVAFDPDLIRSLRTRPTPSVGGKATDKLASMQGSLFGGRDLSHYSSYEEAYHQLMLDIVAQQLLATELVLAGSPVKQLFVDGGFGKNPVYMHLLAAAFPQLHVYAASVAQATALGAAMAIHDHWNPNPLPRHCVQLQRFDNRL